MQSKKISPIDSWHRAHGAKMADFGGWMMPIEYPKPGGVVAEHLSVRERVGLFDVSHLGKLRVQGLGTKEFLNRILTNNLDRITKSNAQYTLICNTEGGVVDDLIAYEFNDSDFLLIPNAANCAKVCEVLRAHAPVGVTISNQHAEFAVFALQGPLADRVLREIGFEIELDYMQFVSATLPKFSDIGEVIVCRTGYTGEHGYELLPAAADAQTLWERVHQHVVAIGGMSCGLGARDTLRTEMGYPLHGHELSELISPLEAATSWAVDLRKPSFIGREALLTQKSNGVHLRLRGIEMLEAGIPRAQMPVSIHGSPVGQTTSGTFSPSLKKGIALALISREIKVESEVEIDIRGKVVRGRVVALPFVTSHVR